MRKSSTILALVLCAAALCCSAQKSATSHMLTRFERTGTTLDGWIWASLLWTGDDKPYQKIRADIYNEIAGGQDAEQILAKYKAQAQAKPADPQAQFAWAYAALRIPSFPGHAGMQVDLTDLPDALAGAPFPRTYDYARIRFLAQSQIRPMAQLEELGKRLIQRDPTDVPVKFQMIHVLEQIPSPRENAEAAQLAQDLIRANPSQLVYHQKLANIYAEAFMDFGFKKADGDKAISAYQDYLRLAPLNDPEREGIERAIAVNRKIESHNP